MVTDFVALTGAGLASALGVAYIKRWAQRHRVLDVPNERSLHDSPVPRGGGIAIVVTVIAGMLLLMMLRGNPDSAFWAWIAGALIVAAISWIDDLQSVPSAVRLVTQSVAAILVIVVAGPLGSVGVPSIGFVPFAGAAAVLTLFWIVGLTNAFNFMDGIDGIAGTQAVCAGAAAAIAAHLYGNRTAECLGVLIAGASIGFLIHNWSPASIFMGDVGSAFLGFSLAAIPLMAANAQRETLFVAVCALWPFLFDTSLTFFRRLVRRENVLRPHRSHLYQRLVQSGFSHSSVVILYAAGSVIASALAILALRSSMFAVVTVIAIPAMAAALTILVSARDVTETRRPAYHES